MLFWQSLYKIFSKDHARQHFKPGIFELEINGKKRGFKFGTWAIAIACEMHGKPQSELYKDLGWGSNQEVDLKALMHMFYGAAVHYCDSKQIKVDFTPADVSDWLDEVGLEKTMEMFVAGFQSHESKKKETSQEPVKA
jgi:hypothetical protein